MRHIFGAGRPTLTAFRFLAMALAPLLLAATIERASAQAPGIMAPGDAVVTGFSGTVPPPPTFAGDPIDGTLIDLNGASMRIERLQPAGPPTGQMIAAPTVFQVPAQAVGQVFPITFDDWPNPNIFLGATSGFGIQIVAPDGNGDGLPDRITKGQPGAAFMDGQWGAGGSPGSIYRIDGTTGAITLFTTIGADSGPGLGDVVFDRSSRQFFVSDLDTGHIYRLDAAGTITDTFDHGVEGRPAHGLALVADDGSTMDITSPSFDSANPATWGYTQPERRVRGLAVYGGRLFYSVPGPQIWSVGINLDGTFAHDPRWELDVAGLASTDEISDIAFDNAGRMILAQRGAQAGSYDYSVFAQPATSSVVRYRREIPDDPTTPSAWVEVPDQYAIGFRPEGHNATGGVALGYGYDPTTGAPVQGACSQYLWSTGDSLRDNAAMAGFLAAGGPPDVHGLQGNDRELVRPSNDPPLQSYFADYDGQFGDPQNQGHVGDVEIWAPCQGAAYYPPYYPPYFPPGYVPPPPGSFNLTLDKAAIPETCTNIDIAWRCEFTVRVTNTGTTPYIGPITVADWLPGAPAGATMSFAAAPWSCAMTGPAAYQCDYPPTLLVPGGSIDLYVTVDLPEKTDLCYLPNAAQILWPPGLGDANPADDFAFASAQIPNASCAPHGDTTNLTIHKEAYAPTCVDGGGASDWICAYLITVTNSGTAAYTGNIVVDDTMSVNGDVVWLPPQWACTNPGPVHTCTFPSASLPDGGQLNTGNSVPLLIGVKVPKAEQEQDDVCTVSNQAEITFAPGGSPMNTNAGDDTSVSVDLSIPAENCPPAGEHSDLTIKKTGVYCVPALVPVGNGGNGPQFTIIGYVPYACTFSIQVHNNGPDDFSGPVTVNDTFAGFAPLSPPVFSPMWACAPTAGEPTARRT